MRPDYTCKCYIWKLAYYTEDHSSLHFTVMVICIGFIQNVGQILILADGFFTQISRKEIPIVTD